MIDESNDRLDNKKLNTLVLVYNQTLHKVSTQFFGIPTCNIGTSSSIFNCLNQAGQSMIGYFHTEMVRLLSKMMGKFVTTRTITAQSDITKVDFRCKDNQHYNTRIAVVQSEFYCSMTETIIKKFPFQDKILQGISFLNPLSKGKLSPNAVISLSDSFLNYNQQETSQLEDEADEYMLTPLCDLQAFDPDTPSLNQFLRLLSGK
ncbi:unnamed protein product [Mytilus edulis]|uniref:Uncharacterized protein n=1 Tax=Mytilus edulis TaxID=6550 RepID=A0A8S3S940_MYTED|nr:unnamed protein product [Mytilus edulis]